ncbi:hypothetical protein [Streptomyces sp. NPDC017529]|uniref:hypothetical protein n=1 Tax=Streptomyces sp. NPDC017529 TaxID=3365000 RepID=UPI0037B84D46
MGSDRHHKAAIRTAAATAARQLTELTGTPARLQDEADAVRIEADVTDNALSHWPRLLAVLDLGTEYGVTTGPDGQVAWLRIALRDKGPRP